MPAIHDRMALDTVLDRLLLAAVPGDMALLERLLPLARQVYAQFPDRPSGGGQVSAYVHQEVSTASSRFVGTSVAPMVSGAVEADVEMNAVEGEDKITGPSLDDL